MNEEVIDTIEDLGNNIKLLKSAKKINRKDCKTLLTQLFEVVKDVLEKFDRVFKHVEKIIEIEKTTENGELSEGNPIKNQDLKNLYL